ncbi:hypothetical protein ACF061_07900 [Streptomyces sp. NPDC015220]|uniref:hypothetical protein n=1 Tax=Streptomyces sp. NPDC015220 TaxID=3364947 RepID=UPI003702BBAA
MSTYRFDGSTFNGDNHHFGDRPLNMRVEDLEAARRIADVMVGLVGAEQPGQTRAAEELRDELVAAPSPQALDGTRVQGWLATITAGATAGGTVVGLLETLKRLLGL